MVNDSKGNVYYSCHCRQCSKVPSKVKGWHKRRAHRAFRRLSKYMLRWGDDSMPKICTGYPA